ncbi:denticleless protein homolog [Liolophura sinensis]|uniref:denticleless protein homolog n=1 Tax=Liolophura sinensis TaxID=3198878 RepID=UPI0031595544
MSIIKALSNRSVGSAWTQHVSLLSGTALLDEFECHLPDEHPIIDDEEGTTVPPLACAFCPVKGFTHVLALADENGCVILYNTHKTGIQAATAEWLSHTNAVFDLTWLKTEQKLITASGDQSAVLWDAVSGDKLEVFKGHTSSVKSVCIGHDNDAVFATGSRDGHIMVWDRRCNKKDQRMPPVNIIRNAHCLPPPSASKSKKKMRMGPILDSQQSVTNVLFQDQYHLVSAGAVDGVVKVWDMRKNYSTVQTDPVPKYSLLYSGFSSRKHGFSSLLFDSTGTRLFASCTDDVIYQYDFINYSPIPVHCYKGHQNSTFYIKTSVSPDDQYIASGSSDQQAYIWKIGHPQESPVMLKGHSAEVTSVAWSPEDFTKIATLSDDNTMRVWRATKRLGLKGLGALIGTAQRVSKDIGVSTGTLGVLGSPLSRKSCVHAELMTPPSQKRSLSLSAQSGPHSSSLGSARKTASLIPQTPPSIKKWFSHAHTGEKPSQLPGSHTKCTEQENVPILKVRGKTIRTPVCKRKLISTDMEADKAECESPFKRMCRDPLEDISSRENVTTVSQTENRVDLKPSCARVEFDCTASPVRKLTQPSIVSSPTANLPNLVMGVGVVTPPKSAKQLGSPCHFSKGRSNWLTKLRLQRQTDSCALLSPKATSGSSAEDENSPYSDTALFSPIRLKSPGPNTKSILSYFRRKENPT